VGSVGARRGAHERTFDDPLSAGWSAEVKLAVKEQEPLLGVFIVERTECLAGWDLEQLHRLLLATCRVTDPGAA
jgi:hypothetical protein